MSTDMERPGLGEGRVNSNTTAKPHPSTQGGRVLHALRQQPMSAAELQWRLKIAHAPAVVRDLRRKGFPIVTERYPHPSRPRETIKRYRLVESQ